MFLFQVLLSAMLLVVWALFYAGLTVNYAVLMKIHFVVHHYQPACSFSSSMVTAINTGMPRHVAPYLAHLNPILVTQSRASSYMLPLYFADVNAILVSQSRASRRMSADKIPFMQVSWHAARAYVKVMRLLCPLSVRGPRTPAALC